MYKTDQQELYSRLSEFSQRPEPFSCYTAVDFWNDPPISRQMLDWHLAENTDRASYRPTKIRELVAWLDSEIGFSSKAVCDLGCGPGLHMHSAAFRNGHLPDYLVRLRCAHAHAASGTA